jgi:succinate dehydrogenase / fumarate reductase flavoprotein subunit
MQGLADGYFVIPYTIGDYLASQPLPKVSTDHDAFREASDSVQKRINRLLSVKGGRGVREIHRALGRIMWDDVGMARTEESLGRALREIPKLRDEFWHNVSPAPRQQASIRRPCAITEFAELLALGIQRRGRVAATSGRKPTPEASVARRRGYTYVAWGFKASAARTARNRCLSSASHSGSYK